MAATTVGTTAVQLGDKLGSEEKLIIHNLGAAVIYIGPANTVTTANGFPIAAGGSRERNHSTTWAISGTAGQDVRHEKERR